MRLPFFTRSARSDAPRSARSTPATGRLIRSPVVYPQHAEALRTLSADRLKRMYDAAVTTNLNADFPVSITSANSEILVSISAARSRARKLERDNAYARAILESFQRNVGGHDPFRLEMKVGKWTDGEFIEETETNREIEEAWDEAGLPENCTVRRDMSRLELDLQAITAMCRDGGVLYRHRRYYPYNEFAYAIEPIEIDRLDHYFSRPQIGNDARQGQAREIQFSMELDEYRGVTHFHILTRHPGDVFAWSNQAKYRERVPAADIIGLFEIRTRAEQYVGMSRLAAIIQHLHRVQQFDVAHVTAAIWASCKPFFLVREFPAAMEYIPDYIKNMMAQDGQAHASNDGTEEGEKISAAEPGTGEELPFGVKPMLVDPKFPIESSTGFKKDNLRAAASGAGAAYHIIANDLENVNFSSGRLGLEEFREGCKILQEHLVLNYRRPHFNAWLKYAILSGKVRQPLTRLRELQRAAHFYGRRWGYVNPLQDVQADILSIEAGLNSRSRVIAESDRGGDVEAVDAEQASDIAIDEKHGLDFGNEDPTMPSVPKGEPGEVEPKPTDADDKAKPPKKKGPRQARATRRMAEFNRRFEAFNRNGH